jgi:hypothetical protein
MNWSHRREKFRALLAGERCFYPTSVFDPISVRIAEDLGYELMKRVTRDADYRRWIGDFLSRA